MIEDLSLRPTGWGEPALDAPGLADVRAAAQRVRDVCLRTPLVPFAAVPNLFLKPECLQPTGSFKLRGVYNWAVTLSREERRAGFSTFSAGNTALALGFCARKFGVRCRSLLPDYAPKAKVAALRAAGVECALVPFSAMADWLFAAGWRNEPYAFLHPWTEPKLLSGHATIGLEIADDLPGPATVFVPVGGGALAAGVASALRALRPGTRIVGVEAANYPSLCASRHAGRPVWVASEHTICDGVAVPFANDSLFPLLSRVLDDVVLVSEDEAKSAMRRLVVEAKLVAEGAGALALAAALKLKPAGAVVAIVSGGNAEPAELGELPS